MLKSIVQKLSYIAIIFGLVTIFNSSDSFARGKGWKAQCKHLTGEERKECKKRIKKEMKNKKHSHEKENKHRKHGHHPHEKRHQNTNSEAEESGN